jgi:hypothetical protein
MPNATDEFNSEDGGSIFHRNTGIQTQDYIVQQVNGMQILKLALPKHNYTCMCANMLLEIA